MWVLGHENSALKRGLAPAGDKIRRPAVAGVFYPGDRQALSRELTEMLEQAGEDVPAPAFPKLLIVPHAGYIYSGPVAASAYDRLRPARGIAKRGGVLGPGARGAARPGAPGSRSRPGAARRQRLRHAAGPYSDRCRGGSVHPRSGAGGRIA